YAIAHTFGIPNPPDDTNLNLGVAALRRFLRAYPEHPWAVRASYQVGAAYLARGQSQPALEAFRAFLKGDEFRAQADEAKHDLARLSMTATFQVGQILQAQEKFAEAIAAWKGYLAQYPNGPQSADALRAILDAELQIAADHLRREQYAEARSAWQAFVARNPLDGRVPQVLFQVGESFTKEKKFDPAIAAWETLLSKFPGGEPAAHAQFAIAALFEEEKGDPAGAIERFQKVAVEPWKSQGAQRVAVMESKALAVVTPRAFRSGETAHLKVTTRNLEKLTFTAYKLNAEAYFRKKHALEDVESLDIGLVRPDAEWTAEVPGYAKYKPVETTYDLKKVEVPGVYVVKVTDEKTLQATTLVVGSDLDAVVKTSREQVLVFAQDMKAGKGRAGARVLVADGEELVLDGKTGEDGVLLRSWDKPRAANAGLRYLVLDGPDAAGSGLGVPEKVAQGLAPRAYLSTDRPAYRPGQKVALRGVVREVKDGQYANVPGASYKLEVSDSRGRQIVARPVTLSAFGTFHEAFPLDSAAPIGTYRVRVYQPGKSDFAGQFEVQAYQLEKIDLSFDLKKTVYFRGEPVEADLVARYPYGAPVANRPIAVLLPDNRIERGLTDASGKFHVAFSTEGFADEQALRLAAQLPQDNVAAVARVMLAVRAFSIGLRTTRDVYLDGESFLLRASTFDAQGEPTGQTLSVSVLKRVTQAGRTAEREVSRKEVTTDPKTGEGSASLKVEDEPGGSFVVRVAGTDRFGNPVVADRELTISGKKDETRLRLLADRQAYQVGEEASVNLHSRGRSGTALLAWEADRILQYRLVELAEGDNRIAWSIDHAQFPNFTLTACRMAGKDFDEARLDVRVERDLRVSLRPKAPHVGPGEAVEVEVSTVDQLGRPVAAEVAVALVDRALLRRFEDKQQAIGPFFYDQARTGAFATAATNTFRYEPATTPVSEAVVEEAERTAARGANAADRAGMMEEAKKQAGQFGAQGIPSGKYANEMATPPPAAPAAGVEMDMAGAGKPRLHAEFGMNAPAGGVNGAVDALGVEGRHLARDAKGLGDKDADAKTFYDLMRGGQAGEEQLAEKGEVMARRGGLALGNAVSDLSAGRKAGAVAPPRERFVETAYWNPSVVTDKEGKATIT
ncbi:MAG TPA: MG2 domain-containing protein, partial [Isosphaeraceae bacterium]|nr:MG2 domain-containing protein [Isosphaeraceae bacterium]